MAPRLEFGTAGIRGRMGPGFGRMNDLVIIQVGLQHLLKIFTAFQVGQGLLAYLLTQEPNLTEKVMLLPEIIPFRLERFLY